MDPSQLATWLKSERVGEVSCIVPDLSGVARGKSIAPELFLESFPDFGLRLPQATYTIAAHGEFTFNDSVAAVERDLVLVPDLSTLHITPWTQETTAGLICDTRLSSGEPFDLAPRQLLKNVIALYHERGWEPIVGPEVEFYLIAKFKDAMAQPSAPEGAAGLPDFGQHAYSLDAIDDFDDFFENMYEYSKMQGIQLDTFIHEDGPCQFEVSLRHTNALAIADQLFLFKRLTRHVAKQQGYFATFMAKPYALNSGSSIHLHLSVVDKASGKNIFADPDGSDSELFTWFIGGLQAHLRDAMPLIAPFTNSYNRFKAYVSAPTNFHWSRDNRTVGLRVPESGPNSRRVENRIPGSDVNPYLAVAASLICGYIGMVEKLARDAEFDGEGYESGNNAFPQTLTEALTNFRASETLRKYLGSQFVDTFADVKQTEYEHRSSVLSPWDMRYLMVNV